MGRSLSIGVRLLYAVGSHPRPSFALSPALRLRSGRSSLAKVHRTFAFFRRSATEQPLLTPEP